MISRLSVEQKYFKQHSQKLQDHLTDNSSPDFSFISEYLDSIESSDSWPCIEELASFQWINTSRPFEYRHDLTGKLVLLDFFTYCCINCLHVLPVLKRLENSHSVREGFVVLGVHSAKFVNERDTSSIERAAERYSILHPIINDHELVLWNLFGISCWPTFLFISPTGRPIYVMIGETLIDKIPQLTELVLRYYRERGMLEPRELPISPGVVSKANFMKYPGKVHIHPKSGLVYVSDTSHHRIVVLNAVTHSIVRILGSGRMGAKDGPASVAEFNSPQGLASNGKVLYVADTENHLVREVDLEEGVVRTICGTGKQGSDREGGQESTKQEISSPWDLVVAGDRSQFLFVAMAGSHQIWVYFLSSSPWLKGTSYPAGTMLRFAGTGDEANRNNSYPHRACFAQPSGICVDGACGLLYIADSESGCVRSVSLKDGGVKAVVGGGLDPLDLFSYGDVDGVGRQARLQHPMGVAFSHNNNSVFVADTYNHRIKVVDLANKSCTTLAGNGKPGYTDGPLGVAQFYEPSGLALDSAGERLFIADTNNHLVRMIDLTAGIVKTVSIEEHEKPKQQDSLRETIHLKVGYKCILTVVIKLPDSIELNPGSGWTLKIPHNCSNSLSASVSNGNLASKEACKFQMVYTHHNPTQDVSAQLNLSLPYCVGNLCYMNQKEYLIILQYDQSCTELEQGFSVSVNIP